MKVGFSDVVRSEIGQSEHPELRGLEQHDKEIGSRFNAIESFVLEAVKPEGPHRGHASDDPIVEPWASSIIED